MKKLILILVMFFAVGITYGQQAAPTPETTVAGVLDKNLDKLTGQLTTLEDTVTKFAPEVWRITLRQQYTIAITDIVFWLFMFLGIYVFYRLMRSLFGMQPSQAVFACTDADRDGNGIEDLYYARVWVVGVFPIALTCLFTVIGLMSVTNAIGILMNPEFYAIQNLLNGLK